MSRADQLARDDPHFVRDLRASLPAVQAVAAWLERTEGYPCTIPPLRVRPTEAERARYRDGGDMIQHRTSGPQRIEVKQRKNLTFTCAADYPYPTALIDERHKLNAETVRYVIVNKALTHCAVAHTRDAARWLTVRRLDKGKNRECEFIECPLPFLTFHCMLPIEVGRPVLRWACVAHWPPEQWHRNLRDALVVMRLWVDADRMRQRAARP